MNKTFEALLEKYEWRYIPESILENTISGYFVHPNHSPIYSLEKMVDQLNIEVYNGTKA